MAGVPQPGEEFGRYRVVDRLGQGGMGVVLTAYDPQLDRNVALKLLPPTLADDAEARARFEREAAVLARMDTPHVVQVHDFGEHDGSLFLVTQLVPGGDLMQRVRTHGTPTPAVGLDLILGILDGLQHAHEAGIIHRDVKPSNVLVRERQQLEPVLCDFGIAAMPGFEVTRTGAVTGSTLYMAPERHAGEPSGVAGDLYSVGCLLWFVLTGSAPYAGTEIEVAMAHLEAPVPQLPGRSEFAKRVNAVLTAAMAKEPSARYRSARAMEADVRAARAVAPAVADLPEQTAVRRPVTPRVVSDRAVARRARLPWMVGTAAAVAVALVAVSVVGARTDRLAEVPVVKALTSDGADPSASSTDTGATTGPTSGSTAGSTTGSGSGATPEAGAARGAAPGAAGRRDLSGSGGGRSEDGTRGGGGAGGAGSSSGGSAPSAGADPGADRSGSATGRKRNGSSAGSEGRTGGSRGGTGRTRTTPKPTPTPQPTWTCWNGADAYAYGDCSLPTGFAGLRWVFPATADVACRNTDWSQGGVVTAMQCVGNGWVMVLREFTSPQAAREYYRDFKGTRRTDDWPHGLKWRSEDGKERLIHKSYRDYPYGFSARGDNVAKAQQAMEVFRPVRQPDRMRGRPR